MIPIPESLAFYWHDATNRAAVNLLVDSAAVPPDLSLSEVERFELAALAAQRVRLDLWRFFRSVWSATWETAVSTELPAARLLAYGGHADVVGLKLTPSKETAWKDRETYGVFELPGKGRLATLVWLRGEDKEVEIAFDFADVNDEWSISYKLELGPDWTTHNDEWRVTRSGLARLAGGDAGFDPTPLIASSRVALRALALALR